MGEFASKGVAGAGLGTGIAGLALGVLNGGWLNGIGNGGWGNGWGRNGYGGCGYGGYGDVGVSEALAARDSEIARLQAKAYSDESDLAVYKYFDGKIKEINDKFCQMELQQCQINSAVNASLTSLSGQIASAQQTLANITRTAIPQSAICDFNSGCNCGTSAT